MVRGRKPHVKREAGALRGASRRRPRDCIGPKPPPGATGLRWEGGGSWSGARRPAVVMFGSNAGRWVPPMEIFAMRARALLTLALIGLPTAALAHTGHGDTSGFLHGFMHPVGGIDHILAMVAVGVFAYVLGGKALWLVPLSFVGMMAVGFLLGIGGVDVPFVELGIALSSG